MLRQRPTACVAVAATMTVVGAMLLSGGMSGSLNNGDVAAILSGACYAVWMVEVERHAKRHGRPLATAAAQFLSAALILIPLGGMYGNLSASAAWKAGPELLVLGIFSTAVGFTLQTIAQRFTLASHAAVMVSAECVFGAAGAALVLGERISAVAALGAALIFAAIVYLALIPNTARRDADPLRVEG
jgi:drug/metabolite transporter (DMT)-like permease